MISGCWKSCAGNIKIGLNIDEILENRKLNEKGIKKRIQNFYILYRLGYMHQHRRSRFVKSGHMEILGGDDPSFMDDPFYSYFFMY